MDYRNPPRPPQGRYHTKPSGRPHQNTSRNRNSASSVIPYEEYSKGNKEKKRVIGDAKGNLPDRDLSRSLTDDENLYKVSEKNDVKNQEKAVITRKCIFTAVCLVFSLGLNVLSFKLPFTPYVLSVDFSPFPELLAALAVNPLAALAVIIVKNGLYLLIKPAAIASIPNKLILDTVYIFLSWALFRRIINSPRQRVHNEYLEYADLPKKDYSMQTAAVSGAVSSVVTSFISVFCFRYLSMPLMIKYLGDERYFNVIFESYREAYAELTEHFQFVYNFLPTLDNLKVGMVVYNIPLTAFKYLCCTFLAAALYPAVRTIINRK